MFTTWQWISCKTVMRPLGGEVRFNSAIARWKLRMSLFQGPNFCGTSDCVPDLLVPFCAGGWSFSEQWPKETEWRRWAEATDIVRRAMVNVNLSSVSHPLFRNEHEDLIDDDNNVSWWDVTEIDSHWPWGGVADQPMNDFDVNNMYGQKALAVLPSCAHPRAVSWTDFDFKLDQT